MKGKWGAIFRRISQADQVDAQKWLDRVGFQIENTEPSVTEAERDEFINRLSERLPNEVEFQTRRSK